MVKIRYVKIVKSTNPINWWYRNGLIGQTFEVLERSIHDSVKIQFDDEKFGWVPLDVCEINPHLRLIK